MDRVTSIVFHLPDTSEANKSDNTGLFAILRQLQGTRPIADDTIQISPSAGLQPVTLFHKAAQSFPSISFETIHRKPKKTWKVGNLIFGFNLENTADTSGKLCIENTSSHRANISPLSIAELLKKFDGKVEHLNHAGMNFGPSILAETDYLEFKYRLAALSNMYDYPTGEEWPFVIPSTDREYLKDIEDESVFRNPKYELVFSEYHDVPLIQFDIQTTLSKEEVIELLPAPFGIALDGLEHVFRTVFITTDWNGVLCRFDLRFRSDAPDFGNWIVKAGKRVRHNLV